MSPLKTAGLIVAAGRSSRMNQFKPLMEIGQTSVISRLIATFQQSGVDPIVLITGHEAERLEAHVKNLDVVVLRNDDYATTEMIDSVNIGLKWLEDQCDRVLFSPGDVPLFSRDTVELMLQSEAQIAIPTVSGQEGHPLLLDASLIGSIVEDRGQGGLRGVLARLDVPIARLETDDLGTQLDADTPDDFEELLAYHNRQLLRPQVHISLARTKTFFTQTSWRLLSLIETTGSVADACQRINISYSKGWQLIRTMEEEMDAVLVERVQGGKSGGSSHLTKEGKRLIDRFERLTKEARAAVDLVFHDIFREAINE